MELKYAVIGVGAIGGYFGGRLAWSGKEVHFLHNSDYNFVKENGLKIDSKDGDFHLRQTNAYQKTSDMPKVDVVLVGLKTTQNHLLPQLIQPLLHKDSVVVIIQNGIGAEETLAEQLPNTQIIGGIAFISSFKAGAGHVKHVDNGKLELGNFNCTQPEILEQIVKDFVQANVHCLAIDNLSEARWKKLLWNIVLNGLSVVLNAKTNQIMDNPASLILAEDITWEAMAGAKACGVHISEEFGQNIIDFTKKMLPYSPSMKLDYDNKRPLEIDAIYTKSIALAAKKGYHMVRTEMLEKQLIYLDQANRIKQ